MPDIPSVCISICLEPDNRSWLNTKAHEIVITCWIDIFVIFIAHSIEDSKYVSIKYKTHYNYVIMGAMASQITSLTIVYSTVYLGADQRKHQNSASLAFVWGILRWPVNSPHKGPVTRKMFILDDVIMVTHKTCRAYFHAIWFYFVMSCRQFMTNHFAAQNAPFMSEANTIVIKAMFYRSLMENAAFISYNMHIIVLRYSYNIVA